MVIVHFLDLLQRTVSKLSFILLLQNMEDKMQFILFQARFLRSSSIGVIAQKIIITWLIGRVILGGLFEVWTKKMTLNTSFLSTCITNLGVRGGS